MRVAKGESRDIGASRFSTEVTRRTREVVSTDDEKSNCCRACRRERTKLGFSKVWPDDFFVMVALRFDGDREMLLEAGELNTGAFELRREE